MNFNHLCNLHNTDKGDVRPFGNCYAHFYDNWFSKIRYEVKNICEIGILDGSSLKVYYDYFPNSKIIALDIHDKKEFNNDRTQTLILDQGSPTELDNFVNDCQLKNLLFDFIIDDGSHDIEHQQLTFGKLFKLVKPNGLYIIEDLGSSYFGLNKELYGYKTTQTKLNNNTVMFLNQRPFSSLWISEENLKYINENIDYVSVFDKLNDDLPYGKGFRCVNDYPIRSITSVIKKK